MSDTSSVIFSMDPSLNSSGICVLPIDSKTPICYKVINPPVGGVGRLSYNFSSLESLLTVYRDRVKYFVFEKQISQMRFGYQAHNILDLAENIGIIKLCLTRTLVPGTVVLGVLPEEIKKFATGNSKATKEDMISKVNGNHLKSIRSNILEWSVNDVVDAYHLARYVQEMLLSGKDLASYIIT